MNAWPVLSLGTVLLLTGRSTLCQNTQLSWSAAGGGFVMVEGHTTILKAMVGLSPVGGTRTSTSTIESGFLVDSLFRGVMVSSPTKPLEVPERFELSQNFPNPFNPTTKIRYELSRRSIVAIEVFNLLGQRISTLFNGLQEVGRYDVEFDGRPCASGVYFCRMTAGEFVGIRKLLLVR